MQVYQAVTKAKMSKNMKSKARAKAIGALKHVIGPLTRFELSMAGQWQADCKILTPGHLNCTAQYVPIMATGSLSELLSV